MISRQFLAASSTRRLLSSSCVARARRAERHELIERHRHVGAVEFSTQRDPLLDFRKRIVFQRRAIERHASTGRPAQLFDQQTAVGLASGDRRSAVATPQQEFERLDTEIVARVRVAVALGAPGQQDRADVAPKSTSSLASAATIFGLAAVGAVAGLAAAKLASGAAESGPSNLAPSSIHFVSSANSSALSVPPPRGMSPATISSIMRLPLPLPAMITAPSGEPLLSDT